MKSIQSIQPKNTNEVLSSKPMKEIFDCSDGHRLHTNTQNCKKQISASIVWQRERFGKINALGMIISSTKSNVIRAENAIVYCSYSSSSGICTNLNLNWT